jgi:hypothetical protein
MDKVTDIDIALKEKPSKLPIPALNLKKINPKVPTLTYRKSLRYNAFLSLVSDVHWQMFRHGSPVAELRTLLGGDIVRLRHTELGSCLMADKQYVGTAPECFVSRYTGEYKEE